MSDTKIIRYPSFATDSFSDTLPPILRRIYAARGVVDEKQLARGLDALMPYHSLKSIDTAASLLADGVMTGKHLMIIGDFDADGATSTAVAVKALKQFGAAQVSFMVPDRFKFGYGLTPEIVRDAAKQQPDILITVDNGIASLDGVAAAKALGLAVVVTDHHLAGHALPEADAIVNPNQPGCTFASKNLAGVGVIFYVMLALRQCLKDREWFETQNLPVPNMANLLDLVALGTVADVVPLDQNNRIMVHQGLARIRAGHCCHGIRALLQVADKDLKSIVASTLGFAVGPRLNAAGRLEDMGIGIECLLAEDPLMAQEAAIQLDELNQTRRDIEKDMQRQAYKALDACQLPQGEAMPMGLCLYDPRWHQGVIGILASRVKDKYHRPVIAFAKAEDGSLKGSARSVKGVHIRDALDSIATAHPGLLTKFGGHAMAAGLSLAEEDFPAFEKAFAEEVAKHLLPEDLQRVLHSDGALAGNELTLQVAEVLRDGGPWGQGFPEPLFDGTFKLVHQRIVGGKHLKLVLSHPNTSQMLDAIAFNVDTDVWPNHRCEKVEIAYRLDVNVFRGDANLQLMIEAIQPV